jgi:vesicle-fusing ATPase
MDNSGLENKLVGGIYNFGPKFTDLYSKCTDFISEIKNSQNTQILTLLLEGTQRCGKTAIAAKLALESDFPFVKLITPESYVGVSEYHKIQSIVKIFEDAYKSNLSLIILDDIERLIEFIHIGPRFSNPILQALLVLIKKCPPNLNRKLMIIGTTSMKSIMQEMDLVDCFNACLQVPTLKESSEIEVVLSQFSNDQQMVKKISDFTASRTLEGLPIKNLMLALELSLQKSNGTLEFSQFIESLDSISGN